MVSSKMSHFDSVRKQLDLINEELDRAHLFDNEHLPDRIRHLISHNKQIETAQHDIGNKYQALLLQTNMLTGIIKQHSTEVANHKGNEEQLKEFNEQLLSENQASKIEVQEYRAKVHQLTNANNQYEHECSLMKQRMRDAQIHQETSKTEQQMLINVSQRQVASIHHGSSCPGITSQTRYDQTIRTRITIDETVVRYCSERETDSK